MARNISKEDQLEIDFVANLGSKRYYIQSAFSMPTEEKRIQEKASLVNVNDSFKKIIVVKDAVKEVGGQMFICADHGNAEQLIDEETGEPFTAHTTNPVPFILVNADPKYTLRENGCLADIVPTLIQLMGMEQPVEMTGKSLLVEK